LSIESKAKTTMEIYHDFIAPNKLEGKEKWVPLEDWLLVNKQVKELEADLKRATKKLDTIDAVAKQLVHMTNIATNLQIQKDEAIKILNEFPRVSIPPDERALIKKALQRLREVLK
jgi:hypothetical protein